MTGEDLQPIPLPPREMRFAVGSEDAQLFIQTGQDFLRYCTEVGGLRPEERMLEIGSGCGRLAIALTSYFSEEGRYEGFDVQQEPVRWCRDNITRRHPNFQFRAVDVRNGLYNPGSGGTALDLRFPYEDGAFDFVLLASVFTHMLDREVQRYLAEIRRVLRPGGRVLASFFLLTPESIRLIDEGKSVVPLGGQFGDFRVFSKECPEQAIAYPEPLVRSYYDQIGLAIEEPVRYGAWCQREQWYDGQDLVLAYRN